MVGGYAWRFYPEEDCVSIETSGFKKDVFAVLRPTGFMRDIDKKGAKGRMFQLSVSVPDEEGNRNADIIVPIDSLSKDDQSFVKKFLESEKEPGESDFEKLLKIASGALSAGFSEIKKGKPLKNPDSEAIDELVSKNDELIAMAKGGFIIDIRDLFYPATLNLQALIAKE